jgi:hypothetical protein
VRAVTEGPSNSGRIFFVPKEDTGLPQPKALDRVFVFLRSGEFGLPTRLADGLELESTPAWIDPRLRPGSGLIPAASLVPPFSDYSSGDLATSASLYFREIFWQGQIVQFAIAIVHFARFACELQDAGGCLNRFAIASYTFRARLARRVHTGPKRKRG